MHARPSSWASVRSSGRSIEWPMKRWRRWPAGVGCSGPRTRVPVCLFADRVGRAGQQLGEGLPGYTNGHRSAVPLGDERLKQDAASLQVLRDCAVAVVGGHDQIAQGVVTATDWKVVELEDARRDARRGPNSLTGSIPSLDQEVHVLTLRRLQVPHQSLLASS